MIWCLQRLRFQFDRNLNKMDAFHHEANVNNVSSVKMESSGESLFFRRTSSRSPAMLQLPTAEHVGQFTRSGLHYTEHKAPLGDSFLLEEAVVVGMVEEVMEEMQDHLADYRYVEPKYPLLPNQCYNDWKYVMRRTMQEVTPGIFLGPYASATRAKLEDMKAAGLTHVVCVRQFLERNLIRPNHPDHFKYLVVEIADNATENIIPHFKTVIAFLDDCLASGGKALVHGSAGNSRSAALVIAYIMSKHGVTVMDAFRFVQKKRFCIRMNEGFMAQLQEYEPIYRAQHIVPIPLPSEPNERTSVKRCLEEPEDDDIPPNFLRDV